MKNKQTLRFQIILGIIIVLLSFTEILQSQTLEGFHLRKGAWGDPPNQYKFSNVAENVGYLTTFLIKEVKQIIPNETIENWEIEYFVFTSIEDAELAMVERLDMSNLYMHNIIDVPLQNGQIGDNCWYQLLVGAVQFLRNNVYVLISPKYFDNTIDTTKAEWLAREVDKIIMESPKVENRNSIKAPSIQSVDILSALPNNWDSTVEVKVNATDPKSQKLYYRKYATGFALISEDGILTIPFNKNTDKADDSSKAIVKIWVWNEDNITSSIEKEIPF